jgi:hypothetical protein
MQLIKLGWKHDPVADLYLPVFVTQADHKVSEIELRPGIDLAWKFSDIRYCPGFIDADGTYRPCPEQKVLPELKYDLCMNCEAELGFKAAFLYGQEPNDRARKYLSQPHYVYLAYFEPGILKVGTASESRKKIRLIEQDALIYAFVAKASSGFGITSVERMISRTLDLAETVRTKHKFQYLGEVPDSAKAARMITDAYHRLGKALGGDKDFAHFLLPEKEFRLENLSSRTEIYYPDVTPSDLSDQPVLFGKFSGMRGKYLLLKNSGNILAFNHKQLTGREIEGVSSYSYKLLKPEQIGLF